MTPKQIRTLLEEIILPHGGRSFDSEEHPNFQDPRVLEYLRRHGREFDKTGLEICRIANRNCHSNVSVGDLILRPDYHIAHGFALGADELWYPHSWGVQYGHIIETCPLEGQGRTKYFGFELPTGTNVNATQGGLENELERLNLLPPAN